MKQRKKNLPKGKKKRKNRVEGGWQGRGQKSRVVGKPRKEMKEVGNGR